MFSFKNFIYFLFTGLNFVYSQDCNLLIPKNALGNGIFSPWYVSTNNISDVQCSQLDQKTSVFVEATILDTDTGNFFVYYPLVLDINTVSAAPISSMPLPVNNVIVIHFGANGNSLTLIAENGDSLDNYNCVNGVKNSVFGQFAYCNAINFFSRVQYLINYNVIKQIPNIGITLKGDNCPTTRHFAVIDQDQSDNVLSDYILTGDLKVAQNNAGNRNNLNITKIISNGSDNRLLNVFILPALYCQSFQAPDLIENNVMRSSLALNEISANQNKCFPQALIPSINPMTLVDDNENLDKVNAYRNGVNMPLLYYLNNTDNLDYCNNFFNIAQNFLKKYAREFEVFTSPDKDVANNLLNFLIVRFINSWGILKCDVLTGKKPKISVITDENGIAIANNICNITTTYNLMKNEMVKIESSVSSIAVLNPIIIFSICFIFIFFI